jgi:hypothetical protein
VVTRKLSLPFGDWSSSQSFVSDLFAAIRGQLHYSRSNGVEKGTGEPPGEQLAEDFSQVNHHGRSGDSAAPQSTSLDVLSIIAAG